MYAGHDEAITFAKQKDIMDQLGISSPVVVDVGANIGQSILNYRGLFPDCPVYSIEANPEIMPQLMKNTAQLPDVHIFHFALSDAIGESRFHVTSVKEASSLLKPEPFLMALSRERKYDFHELTVPTLTLDAFVENEALKTIDILKIDVQGAELKVLEGGKDTLDAGLVKCIYIEATLASTYVGQVSLNALLTFMATCRFQLWDIQPFVYTRVGRAWTANAIFVHEDAVNGIEG